MNKRLYVFPGQGSQHPGMGKELFSRYASEVDLASACLGYSIETLCLEDPEGVLSQTQYTQIRGGQLITDTQTDLVLYKTQEESKSEWSPNKEVIREIYSLKSILTKEI